MATLTPESLKSLTTVNKPACNDAEMILTRVFINNSPKPFEKETGIRNYKNS